MIHPLLLFPSIASAFYPTLMSKPLPRRTSSVAYDDQSHGPKYSFSGEDALRGRNRVGALSSSRTDDDCSDKPLFSFGILTDIQYAPIPDGYSYNGTPRYYRHAIAAAEHAARHFETEKVQCVLNLGDIIDGKCLDVERHGGSIAEEKKMESAAAGSVGHQAVDDVLKALSAFKNGRIIHTYGNHELYNLSRQTLGEKLNIPFTVEETGDLVGYYSHHIESKADSGHNESNSKLRFVVLDSYDICVLDRCPKQSNKHQRAREVLSMNNPNYPEEENSPEGLEGLSKRFVAFGGGIDTPQLQWFEALLQSARENGERVIIVSHQPIHPGSAWPTCLMWNYADVLDIMRTYKDVIIGSFSGHAHKGGYVRDEASGIHFRTLEAVLESPDPIRTYGIVEVWNDQMILRGSGDCVSDVYDLDHLAVVDEHGNVHNLHDSFEARVKIVRY